MNRNTLIGGAVAAAALYLLATRTATGRALVARARELAGLPCCAACGEAAAASSGDTTAAAPGGVTVAALDVGDDGDAGTFGGLDESDPLLLQPIAGASSPTVGGDLAGASSPTSSPAGGGCYARRDCATAPTTAEPTTSLGGADAPTSSGGAIDPGAFASTTTAGAWSPTTFTTWGAPSFL